MSLKTAAFYEAGSVTDHINVEISFQIIGLFSEGLYSSPNKAIEELVSNAFDADATCVHTVMSTDRASSTASIAILDNGTGMDGAGLKTHWIVGDSVKSQARMTAKGRRTIGKFGIGKLASYVLGNRLTHISKSGGKFYSTSMDFTVIPKPLSVEQRKNNSAEPAGPVQLDLRELTEDEARQAVRFWLTDDDGRAGLQLFGDSAEQSWTVAIITDLKPMAVDLSVGMLRWVLSTAMPLRDDFGLHLNGKKIVSSKSTVSQVGSWIIGKDIVKIPSPAPEELEVELDDRYSENENQHWTLVDKSLGPVTGYLEVFRDPIDTGKSAEIGRSNGFFVYVHGRLINSDDAGFGIDRNSLRHGTFSRFRLVINIDRLDEKLRSSRETLQAGPMVERAREVLRGLFNLARSKLEAFEAEVALERRASQRFSDSPASLTERPILRMAVDSYEDRYQPRHLLPLETAAFQTKEQLIEHIEARIAAGEGLIGEPVYADIGTLRPIAVLDAVTGALSINTEHPFVAHFFDEFSDRKKNLPLELFAVAEILLEAELGEANVGAAAMASILDSRDELLRHLARSSGARNSITVAQNLIGSVSNAKGLELALVDAFLQLGFEAIPKGKGDEADGLAEAHLAAGSEGPRGYRVALEAKSKVVAGARVKNSAVHISTIARHRDELHCNYAIVVGPDFETGPDDLGAVMREIRSDRAANPNKHITLMRVPDLARLVRLAPVKRVSLAKIRDLFLTCQSPDEASAWVDEIEGSSPSVSPHQHILEMVWELQHDDQEHTVDYGSLRTALRYRKGLTVTDQELREECRALSRMAPDYFVARDDRVELNIKPENVMNMIHLYIADLPGPGEEQ
jgi:hypothetical protein